LGLLPAGGSTGITSVILPAVALSVLPIAAITRLLRSSMLETLRAGYVTTAVAKGVPRYLIIRRHVLRNALPPTMTYGGILLIVSFLQGAIIVETAFSWPGIGQLLYQAILSRDFPIVQAIALLFTGLYVAGSIAIDSLNEWLDPYIAKD
jgi:peptide/nickel transport system permease protein